MELCKSRLQKPLKILFKKEDEHLANVKNKYIKQFRYYGCGDRKSQNYPNFTSAEAYLNALTNDTLFTDYGGITKLGIQCRPNTRFYLNKSPYEIVVGETGIYEIDLEGYGQISSIKFVAEDLRIYDQAGVTDRLLIDIVYEGAGVST